MGLESRYHSKELAKLWADTQRKIAVIVGVETQKQLEMATNLIGLKIVLLLNDIEFVSLEKIPQINQKINSLLLIRLRLLAVREHKLLV